jgi:competence protein ComEA
MDSQALLDKYSPFLKRNWLVLALGFLGLILFAYGLIALFGSSDSSKEIIFEPGGDSAKSDTLSSQDQNIKIIVDVEGAVIKPGIYTLPLDSRLSDALIAAGGLSENADRDWLAKNINLAAKLNDGSKIYIPRAGETETGNITPFRSASPNFEGQAGIMGNASEQINVNTASEQLLDTLPGVGPVTAQKIISGRPYSSIDELLSNKIVGSKVFEDIKEKISVY